MPAPHPWLASLLSLFLPGLGHLYVGERRNGLNYIAASVVATVVFTALRLTPPVPSTVVCMFAISILFMVAALFVAFKAFGAARRARATGRARARWRPVLLLLAAALVMDGTVSDWPSWFGRGFYTYSMSGDSMGPGLPAGTRLYTSQDPAVGRGMVATFYPRDGSDDVWMKRIVAVAGDHVQFRGGRLFVNNEAAAPTEPAVESLGGHSYRIIPIMPDDRSVPVDTLDQTVPPGTVFVLGDNRGNSLDSRFAEIGPVPLSRVIAVGGLVYWMPGEGIVLRQLD